MTRRVAMISEHASPVALLGGVDAGGQNVYVDAVSRGLVAHGYRNRCLHGARRTGASEVVAWADGVRVIEIPGRAARSAAERRALAAHAGVPRSLSTASRDERALATTSSTAISGCPAGSPRSWALRWRRPTVQIFHATGVTKLREQGAADTSPDREDRGREGRRAGGRSADRPMPRRTGRAAHRLRRAGGSDRADPFGGRY